MGGGVADCQPGVITMIRNRAPTPSQWWSCCCWLDSQAWLLQSTQQFPYLTLSDISIIPSSSRIPSPISFSFPHSPQKIFIVILVFTFQIKNLFRWEFWPMFSSSSPSHPTPLPLLLLLLGFFCVAAPWLTIFLTSLPVRLVGRLTISTPINGH